MRIFAQLGIHLVAIGPLVNYNGIRQPCLIKVDDLLDGAAKKDLSYWNMLTNNGQYQPKNVSEQYFLQNYGANFIVANAAQPV